jgi:hypothetical protein
LTVSFLQIHDAEIDDAETEDAEIHVAENHDPEIDDPEIHDPARMTESTMRVYVNARGYDVPSNASAVEAVRVADLAEADAVSAGTRTITDSRGLPVTPDTPAYAGVIYRVVANRGHDAGEAQ